MTGRFKSLTWKQTNLVVFTALFFAIAIFIVEIALVVLSTKQQLTTTQQELLNSVEQPAANAVWALDDNLARQTLEGAIKVEHVGSAVIELDDGSMFVSVSNTKSNNSQTFVTLSNKLFDELKEISRPLYRPFYFEGTQKQQLIGTLTLFYDTQELTDTLFSQLKLGFFATLARALLLTLVLSVVFHRFLTQPIARISEAIDKIDPDSPDENLLPVSNAHKDDELGLVTSKFNQILIQFSQTQSKLRKMATRDPLTGLPNRTLLLETIAVTIQRSRVHKRSFALMFIDLDRFKNINDSLGHALGDQFLARIARILERVVGDKGTVSRLGGDEFVILADAVHSPDQAADFVDKLLVQLNVPIQLNEHAIHPAASIGISIYPEDGNSAEDLIRHADIAMYSAKAAGSNQWAFFKQQMTERAAVRLRTEASLHDALKNNEFLLYFQPKLDLQTGKVTGCEALIRWQKDGRLISPMSFIPVAEETGIIIPIGRWVIEQSCKTLREWQKKYHFAIPIAINVASQQFADASLVSDIKQMALRYQIQPELLEIEITETSLMNDIELAINKLEQLKSAGFGIAVDDFGTGYSSLSYLRHLPITTMKIDRCFVSDLPEDSAIASTILMLGKQLNLTIVAEGIENELQLDWLKENQCQIGQGFYFSQPLPQAEFETLYIASQTATITSIDSRA
ncbi:MULTISPECIES: putative bifunctional diguanylate cyclase/phosphodiesterase [Shewanella]|uniref:Diguanylate cyclase/phosphodiesterase with extracellular sensor n=3 Tax=Shewanella putrefaciens TaxID=24 RepID=E6XJ82_SHEP2|nr:MULTISPECIES: EAL domain-containing protein [Shewanella]ABM23924.1 diguanylate cyclase/phosphodiesterase [Shewanella sp. W3-18-1]AVV85708.1 D-glycero-D-manno-heptose 7-phosphate kinase [Shewanella putrefaciens]MCT8944923.1 EAL domain-containing protein [Shewanella putrefaciens]MDR6962748.1 diguanylate cyclase (GGDEF)-like protein [Shewanella putrefaciens]QGS49071.1 EAL domain-containing protein [Shewanella putrefaciens]